MSFLGPLHRYTFGFGWQDSNSCAHSDHKDRFDKPQQRKRKRKSSTNNRIASFPLVRRLANFPYGGRICANHIKQVYSSIHAEQSADDELDTFSAIHSYEMQLNKSDELGNVNTLLTSLDHSPLRSQAAVRLEEQTSGAILRLTAKLRQAVSIAGMLFSSFQSFPFCKTYCISASNLAEGIAPGQGETLLQLSNLHGIGERRSSNISTSSHNIDEHYLEHLIKMYHSYEEKIFHFKSKFAY